MFSCPPNFTTVGPIDLWMHLIEVEQCLDLVKVPEERNQKSAILQLKHKQQCSFNIEVSHH